MLFLGLKCSQFKKMTCLGLFPCVKNGGIGQDELYKKKQRHKHREITMYKMGFQGGAVVKNPPANTGDARDMGLIPGSRRSPGEGNGNPLQYSCLEIPGTEEPGGLMEFTGLQKSQTQLSS